MKKEVVFDGRGHSRKLNRIGSDIQRVNKVSVKLLELTGRTPTVHQLLKIMEPGRLVERQQRAKGVFFELARVPGMEQDDPLIIDFLTFLMSIPAGLQVLPGCAAGVEVLEDGSLQMSETLVEQIRGEFTHELTDEQKKARDWSERWIELMNEPISNKIGFLNQVRSRPLTIEDRNGKLSVNESSLINIK
jgi:hypothetical protein